MTFINTVKQVAVGFGTPGVYVKRENVATNVGTVSSAMPASGSFTPTTLSSGRLRMKTVSIVNGGTVQVGGATLTDGSTTVNVCPIQTVLSANVLMDFTAEFVTDLNGTSMALIVIAGTQNSVHDLEVAGNP